MLVFEQIVDFIRKQFPNRDFIPLHEPVFSGNEKKYVLDTIDSTFVSSVGKYVDDFEKQLAKFTGAKYAAAIVNGTSALHLALLVVGVKRDEEVITQALSFIATSNAISYIGAHPCYLDVDKDTMGLSPEALTEFINKNTFTKEGKIYNKSTGRRISACVPMHTFGFPCRIDEIVKICEQHSIHVIEDAAESIGSYYKGVHTGTFGALGVFSFNGNKTITCGGGGAIITNNEKYALFAKHLSTQAKMPHKWEFNHDHIGYNYRMPNINAALACAQLEQLNHLVSLKRKLSRQYATFFRSLKIQFIEEGEEMKANYWLNAIMLDDSEQRDAFLTYTNNRQVMTRPIWNLLNELNMFRNCYSDALENSKWISDRLVNIPSSASY